MHVPRFKLEGSSLCEIAVLAALELCGRDVVSETLSFFLRSLLGPKGRTPSNEFRVAPMARAGGSAIFRALRPFRKANKIIACQEKPTWQLTKKPVCRVTQPPTYSSNFNIPQQCHPAAFSTSGAS